MNEKQQIEEMAKHCHFCEKGKCLLLGDEAVDCDTECDICEFAKSLFNAGYRKQCGWISVDERLPDKSGNYLVLTTNGNRTVLVYSAEHRLFNAFDNLSKAQNEMYAIPVDYWMMLPEAPKLLEVNNG